MMQLFSGFVIDYISHPVIDSFTTAAAITIAEGQVKVRLGLTEFRIIVYKTVLETGGVAFPSGNRRL